MNNSLLILSTVLAFGLSFALTAYLSDTRSRLKILDQPNERSLHSIPTPHTGGIAIYAGLMVGCLVSFFYIDAATTVVHFMVLVSLVALLSLLDDIRDLSISLRFLLHIGLALALSWLGYMPQSIGVPGWDMTLPLFLMVILTTLYVVWMINLYNFMDGMDGFAGGMAIFGFGTFAVIAYLENDMVLLSVSLLVVFSVLGFLRFNFPPARIFMGDSGSATLGFAMAMLSLYAHVKQILPLWLSILIFSPFIVDATVTLIKRVLRGEKFWQAHKTHYYQRLVEAGWGHKKTVMLEYVLMLAVSLTALLVYEATSNLQIAVLLIWLFIYLSLMMLSEIFVFTHSEKEV